VLLDRADPAAFGGLGERLDWRVAAQIGAAMPVWLAGGLTPENVAEAVTTVRPWAVDVSSGVETDGVKDAAKVQAFIAAVRGRMERLQNDL
jgi:phosphoribosylanthranilate isomerase